MLCEMLNLRERHDATKDECQARYIGVERIFSKYVEEVVNEKHVSGSSPSASTMQDRMLHRRQNHSVVSAKASPKTKPAHIKIVKYQKTIPTPKEGAHRCNSKNLPRTPARPPITQNSNSSALLSWVSHMQP